jgi:hypothetical protein
MKTQSASANKEYYVDNIDNSGINRNNADLFALLCFIVCQQLLLGTIEAYQVKLTDFRLNIEYTEQSSIKRT